MNTSAFLRASAVAAVLFTCGQIARADATDVEPRTKAIRGIFQPFQTDRASLAPDGKHLAFEKRDGDRLLLALVNLETNEVVELPLTTDIPTPLSGMKEKVPIRMTSLKWVNAGRVVVGVQDEVLVAVDADGRNFKTLLDALQLQRATIATRKPENSARVFMVDLTTNQVVSTEAGRSIIYGPDGEPIDQGMNVPKGTFSEDPSSPDRVIVTPDLEGVEGPAPGRIGEVGKSATLDLFNSSAQAGPTAKLRSRVVAVDLPEPDAVVVEITGLLGPSDDIPQRETPKLASTLVKIDTRTGKILGGTNEFFTTRLLADPLGNPRATLHHSGTSRTLRLAEKPGGGFAPYDKVLAGSGATGFGVTPATLLDPRSVPLGFGYNPSIFYYASNVGRETFAIRSVDVAKKQDTGFVLEHPALDFVNPSDMLPEDVLVFDRHLRGFVGARLAGLKPETFWVDRDLAKLQATLETGTKGMHVEILDWDATRTKFLVKLSEQNDPGGFYIYDAKEKKMREYVRRAPWLARENSNLSRSIALKTKAGVNLTGYLTFPRVVRITPLPLLVYLHDGPWSRDQPGYDRGAQALAAMGFAVLQVNYRGSAGFGKTHLEALRQGGEKVALEDILATVDWVQTTEGVSQKRVAILGNGYGGYLALRALQDFPDRFRCGVSINAPTDLGRWINDAGQSPSFNGGVRTAFFGADAAKLAASSPALNGKPIRNPLLVVQARNDQFVPERHARDLLRALGATDSVKPEFLDLDGEGHARWLPGSYVKVFDRLEEFFTTNIYSYTTGAGKIEVMK